MVRSLFLAGIALGLSLIACHAPISADDPKEKIIEDVPAAMKPYADKLLEIANTYERFGRVDDEMRWAPGLCRMPMPAQAHFSKSKDQDTHGGKLYSMFAKDRAAYFQFVADAKNVKPAPIGQVIVKESWFPEESKVESPPQPVQRKLKTDESQKVGPPFGKIDHFQPYAKKEGKWYKASKLAGLYVMMKYDPKTTEADEGWIYGTVSADLKRVTSVGRVASCMECHTKAKSDRLFGVWKLP